MAAKPPNLAARPIDQALADDAGFANLLQRARASRERLAALAPLLPGPLAAQLQAGALDPEGWTLLAPNASAAAKLRHLRPQLEAFLAQGGWQPTAIRIRVQPAGVR